MPGVAHTHTYPYMMYIICLCKMIIIKKWETETEKSQKRVSSMKMRKKGLKLKHLIWIWCRKLNKFFFVYLYPFFCIIWCIVLVNFNVYLVVFWMLNVGKLFRIKKYFLYPIAICRPIYLHVNVVHKLNYFVYQAMTFWKGFGGP